MDVGQLAAPREKDRLAAGDALVAAGAAAVGPLLTVLGDDSVEWRTVAALLRRIGAPAFTPLVDAIATAPNPQLQRRLGWVFASLGLPDHERYLPVLRHGSAAVRANAVFAFALLKDAAVPYAPALVPLLGDPDADVRQRAVRAFAEIGTAGIPLLREARRTRGAHRPAALTALAETGGWDALEHRDQALVERLVRVKHQTEVPQPMHLCGSWYAVPTDDQAAVLDAFGLTGPRPVTMRLGEAAWTHDHHHPAEDSVHGRCARMYVTPVLDGWTLIFGELAQVAHADWATCAKERRLSAQRHCEELSARFGTAHWYGTSCEDSWTAWCLAEHGSIVRFYDVDEPDQQVGPPHPAESGYLLPHEDALPDDAFDGVSPSEPVAFAARYQQVKRELAIPDEAQATTIAGRASVDPTALGPHTVVRGQGVLATTRCGRHLPSPRGSLSI